LGSWVLARNSATPALKPTSTASEIKFTIAPALTAQARNPIRATRSAVQAAKPAKREVSPPARSASDEPTSSEIADVTVIEVWRELQNSQKTSPENMHA
jgi:hypothetical protein